MKEQELIESRGYITDRLTHLDNALCLLISRHYFKIAREDFIEDILYERDVPVSSKVKMLKKIFKRLELEVTYLNKINSLMEIRNIFGHSWTVVTEDNPVGASQKNTDLTLRKNDTEDHNLADLKNEFEETFTEVQQYLLRLLGADPTKKNLQSLPKEGDLSVE